MNKNGLSKIATILIAIGTLVLLFALLIAGRGLYAMWKNFTSVPTPSEQTELSFGNTINIDFTITGYITSFDKNALTPNIGMYAESITSISENAPSFFNFTKREGGVTVSIKDPDLLKNKDKFMKGTKLQIKGDIIENAKISEKTGMLTMGMFVAKEILLVQ